MKLLLDTHLLLWAAGIPGRQPPAARALIKGVPLVTADRQLGDYPGQIRLV